VRQNAVKISVQIESEIKLLHTDCETTASQLFAGRQGSWIRQSNLAQRRWRRETDWRRFG